VADAFVVRAFLWPARVLAALLVASAILIAILVADPLGAIVMLAVLGGLALRIVYRPGLTMTDGQLVYRPFFTRRKKIGLDHVNNFYVATVQGRPGAAMKIIAANTSGRPLMMYALGFHGLEWTNRTCETLNKQAVDRRRRRHGR
jgi:hypothetical protein